MRVLVFLAIIFPSLVFSQKNMINIDLLGRTSMYALSYERQFIIKGDKNISVSIGLGVLPLSKF